MLTSNFSKPTEPLSCRWYQHFEIIGSAIQYGQAIIETSKQSDLRTGRRLSDPFTVEITSQPWKPNSSMVTASNRGMLRNLSSCSPEDSKRGGDGVAKPLNLTLALLYELSIVGQLGNPPRVLAGSWGNARGVNGVRMTPRGWSGLFASFICCCGSPEEQRSCRRVVVWECSYVSS